MNHYDPSALVAALREERGPAEDVALRVRENVIRVVTMGVAGSAMSVAASSASANSVAAVGSGIGAGSAASGAVAGIKAAALTVAASSATKVVLISAGIAIAATSAVMQRTTSRPIPEMEKRSALAVSPSPRAALKHQTASSSLSSTAEAPIPLAVSQAQSVPEARPVPPVSLEPRSGRRTLHGTGLGEEYQVLVEGYIARREGRNEDAVRAVEQHRVRYPNGALRAEREALRSRLRAEERR